MPKTVGTPPRVKRSLTAVASSVSLSTDEAEEEKVWKDVRVARTATNRIKMMHRQENDEAKRAMDRQTSRPVDGGAATREVKGWLGGIKLLRETKRSIRDMRVAVNDEDDEFDTTPPAVVIGTPAVNRTGEYEKDSDSARTCVIEFMDEEVRSPAGVRRALA